jgi:hypothetical protein
MPILRPNLLKFAKNWDNYIGPWSFSYEYDDRKLLTKSGSNIGVQSWLFGAIKFKNFLRN